VTEYNIKPNHKEAHSMNHVGKSNNLIFVTFSIPIECYPKVTKLYKIKNPTI